MKDDRLRVSFEADYGELHLVVLDSTKLQQLFCKLPARFWYLFLWMETSDFLQGKESLQRPGTGLPTTRKRFGGMS